MALRQGIKKKVPIFEVIKRVDILYKNVMTTYNLKFKSSLRIKRSIFLFSIVLLIFVFFSGHKVYAAPVINLTGQTYTNSGSDPITGPVWSNSMTTSCTGNITVEFSLTGLGSPVLQYQVNGGGWSSLLTSPATINAGASATVNFQVLVTGLNPSEGGSFDLLVFEQLTVTYTSVSISCNGLNDGSIDVTASCGEGNPSSFAWTGPESYTSSDEDITGLAPGDYSLTVTTDEGESETLGPITITEPASLSFLLAGQNWSCASPSCNGSITVTVNGGTAPYDITGGITGTDESSPYEVTGLCAGDYTVSVSDANGCAATDQTRAISSDNEAPTCNFPTDYLLQSSSFGMLTMVPETIANSASYIYEDGGTHTPGYENDTVAFNDINIANFDDVQFKLDVAQSNVSTWNSNDLIRVEISTNGGLNWSPIFTDFCRWDAINEPSQAAGPCDGTTTSLATSWVDIPDLSGTTFSIRLICITEALDRTYTVNSFFVRANNTRSAISPSVAGNASCSDNYSTSTTTNIDGGITWLCNESTNLEFYFTRTWQSTDDCGLSTTGSQRISVGTNPTLADPRDTIFDFCHNENVTISFPASSDNCDDDLQIDYVVRAQEQPTTISSGGNPSSVGSVQFTNIFESNEATDTEYVITWTATDDAGFSTTQDQRVTIRRPITASISPNQDFCSGQSVSFTITLDGGTGSYDALVPGDALGGPVSIVPNGIISGNTFTTSNLTTANPNIQVIITDKDVAGAIGGCSSTFTFDGKGGNYHVHENITTNPLQRD